MKNPFANIFSKMTLLRGDDNGSVVGVDVGSSTIKVIEIKKKEQ